MLCRIYLELILFIVFFFLLYLAAKDALLGLFNMEVLGGASGALLLGGLELFLNYLGDSKFAVESF